VQPGDLREYYDEADASAGYICSRCVGEEHLRSEIKSWGRPNKCEACKEEHPTCVGIINLALRMDVVYRQLVNYAEQDWPDDGPGERGTSPVELFLDLMSCPKWEIAEAMVGFLANHHAYEIHHHGDTDWYDAESEAFTLRLPNNPLVRSEWLRFHRSIKHEGRFFNRDATQLLDRILGPILRDERSVFKGAIRTVGPEDVDRFIFRGRVANDEAARAAIYSSPIRQLGPPLPTIATAGRMNPAGISVFYGSGDALTCVAELRAPVGGSVIVGCFEIIRPLRLLDLTVLEKIENTLSFFDPLFMEVHDVVSFVPGFHKDIRKPVIPGQEALEYVPTQVVAEYLWTRPDHAVDGLIFSSSQVSGDRTNIVLFPRACIVEGAGEERRRKVAHVFQVTRHEFEATEELVRLVPEASDSGLAKRKPLRGLVRLMEEDRWVFTNEPEPAPALRLGVGTLMRAVVEAIEYEVGEARVLIEDDKPLPF
jgi:hypothetical protein